MGWAARANATVDRKKPRVRRPRAMAYDASTHVRFRPLEQRDVPTIYRWFDRERRRFWLPPETDLAWFRALVDSDAMRAHAVLRGGFLSGFALLRPVDGDPSAVQLTVLVDPKQRYRGLGGLIVDEMIRLVAVVGTRIDRQLVGELRFGVFADNAAGIALMAGAQTRQPKIVGPAPSFDAMGRGVMTFTLPIAFELANEKVRTAGRQT